MGPSDHLDRIFRFHVGHKSWKNSEKVEIESRLRWNRRWEYHRTSRRSQVSDQEILEGTGFRRGKHTNFLKKHKFLFLLNAIFYDNVALKLELPPFRR